MKNTILYPFYNSKNTVCSRHCIIYSMFDHKREMKVMEMPISRFGTGTEKEATHPYHITAAGYS